MDRSTPATPTPAEVVRAVFTERGRQWETHDALMLDLAQRCRLDPRSVERALDRLLSDGSLDAITLCHCPPGASSMVVESGYQPGPRLFTAVRRTAVA